MLVIAGAVLYVGRKWNKQFDSLRKKLNLIINHLSVKDNEDGLDC